MVGVGTKIVLGVAALGTAASMTGAATLAMFSASAQSPAETFAAGTVAVGSPGTAGVCTLTDGYRGLLAPGGEASCTYRVSYTGSLPAYLAFAVTATSRAENPLSDGGPGDGFPGSASLFDVAAAGGENAVLTATYSDAAGDSGSGAPAVYVADAPTSGYDTWTAAVPTTVVTASDGSPAVFTAAGPNDSLTVTAAVSLPLTAGDAFQGAQASVAIQVAAVQAVDNPNPSPSQFPLAPAP
jgi:hypothetical protein